MLHGTNRVHQETAMSTVAPLMPIDHIPDWDKRLARQDAFWTGGIIDRPVVTFAVAKPNPKYPWPAEKTYPALRDRWLDPERMAQRALAGVMNTEYGGDALPCCIPNLGPEVFSAFFGCELEYGEGTSWSIPNLHDWADLDKIQFDADNFYWRHILAMMDALLAVGKGKFYTGITDLHPGGDAIVAFRDPLNMNIDMIEHPAEIKRLLKRINQVYFHVYDVYHHKLTRAGQAIGSWPGIVSTKKWYVPSNDFSCMVSKAMFDDVFLPGIIEECKFMEASVYHLDGPDALRHLDSLLTIKELNVIQWVYGAGHGRASDWMPVYKKCQAAGKGLQLGLAPDEIDFFMENLRPEGLWIGLHGVSTREEGDALVQRLARWK